MSQAQWNEVVRQNGIRDGLSENDRAYISVRWDEEAQTQTDRYQFQNPRRGEEFPRVGVPSDWVHLFLNSAFLEQICTNVARYRMLHQGDRVGVAVSGGADSLCLLYVLLELRAAFDLELSVIHVDHNLRGPESQADAQFVHKTAQQLSLPFHIRKLDLAGCRGNLEQEGRHARYQFFRKLIRDGAVQKVALGHTRSDQAETVLFRLLRGAGSAGLAGIRPVTNAGIIRPLLQVTRDEVENWLSERCITWRQDLSNLEPSFDRNRIRLQLIPRLQADWNPQITEILAQTADWALGEELYWQQEIPRLTGDWVRFVNGGAAIVDAGKLNELPVAAARRVIRHVIEQVKHDLLGVGFLHIEAVRQLASRADGDGRVQIPGLEVVRSFHWLRFARPDNPTDEPADVELNLVAGSTVYNAGSTVYNKDGFLDWVAVCRRIEEHPGNLLVIRNWRPGDRYQRPGHAGPEKMKRLFQERRIPSWERHDWPVVAVGGSIVWAGLFGPAAGFAATAESPTVLRIMWNHEIWK